MEGMEGRRVVAPGQTPPSQLQDCDEATRQQFFVSEARSITVALEGSIETQFHALTDKLNLKLDALFDRFLASDAKKDLGHRSHVLEGPPVFGALAGCHPVHKANRRVVVPLDGGVPRFEEQPQPTQSAEHTEKEQPQPTQSAEHTEKTTSSTNMTDEVDLVEKPFASESVFVSERWPGWKPQPKGEAEATGSPRAHSRVGQSPRARVREPRDSVGSTLSGSEGNRFGIREDGDEPKSEATPQASEVGDPNTPRSPRVRVQVDRASDRTGSIGTEHTSAVLAADCKHQSDASVSKRRASRAMRFSRHQGSEAFPEEMLNWSWKDGDAVLQPATAVESQLVRKRTHLRPQTFWGRIEASRHFESSMGGLIVLNCITMGLQAHAQVNNIQDPSLDLFLSVAEHVFTTSFTMEVLLRFVVHGFKAFTLHTSEGRGNFVDALLIFLTGTLLVWIIPVLAYTVKLKVSGDSLRTLTVLRAVRLVRLLRVFHRVHLFREAWMLIRGLKDSTRTLFWTVIVICLVTYVYSIFGLVTMVSELHSVRRSLVDFEEIDKMTEVLEYVGGLGSLMYTLIQILTQDSFHHFTRDILYFVPWSWVYFYGYIAVACFVLMNLVTAIIVENALSTSNHDQENKAMDMERKKDRELKELKKLFSEMDADESGTLCWDEFRDSFEDPVMSRKWMLLDFQPRDCKELFDLLDNGDGEIETEEFFEGLTKIKGTAQAKDVLWLQKNIFKLQDSLETVFPEIVKLPASRYTDMRNDPSGAASATASATGLASLASF